MYDVLPFLYVVAPELRPGWVPFAINRKQQIIWPSIPVITRTFNVEIVEELHFACLIDGRPRAEVVWTFNGIDIETTFGITANVTELSTGKSVLSIDVRANVGILSGENIVECSGVNAGGSINGRVIIQGICKIINYQYSHIFLLASSICLYFTWRWTVFTYMWCRYVCRSEYTP